MREPRARGPPLTRATRPGPRARSSSNSNALPGRTPARAREPSRRATRASSRFPGPRDPGPRKRDAGCLLCFPRDGQRVAGCSKDTRARPRVFTRVTSPPHPTHPLLSQDDILRRAVAQYKGKNWKKIGACIPLTCTTALFGRPRDRGERRSPGNAQSAPLDRATASRFPRRARLARSRALLVSPPPPAFHPFFLSRADPPPPPPRLLAWI